MSLFKKINVLCGDDDLLKIFFEVFTRTKPTRKVRKHSFFGHSC